MPAAPHAPGCGCCAKGVPGPPPALPVGELPATTELYDEHYEPVPLHFKVPHGVFLHEATSVAVDGADNVYVFNRGNVPVLVFAPNGECVGGWGNPTPYAGTEAYTNPYNQPQLRWRGSEFARPHAVHVDHEGHVWLVDDLANTVSKCDGRGRRLMVLAPGGRALTGRDAEAARVVAPSPLQGGAPFNRPTDVAVHPRSGELFISDGYGNSQVHHFSPSGRLIRSWGVPGTDPGEFNLPHSIAIHPDLDKLMVADRENSRVQVFTLDGGFVAQWPQHRAVAVCTGVGPTGRGGAVFIGEQGSHSRVQRGPGDGRELDEWTPRIGHRVCVLDGGGRRTAVLGASTSGERPGQFNWLHSLAVDSLGDVYAAEVSFVECGRSAVPHAREVVSLRKWRRRGGARRAAAVAARPAGSSSRL